MSGTSVSNNNEEFFVEDILEEIFSLTLEDEEEICSEELHDSHNGIQNIEFKNPNKISIDALHLERTVLERSKEVPVNDVERPVNFKQYYRPHTETIPALDERWLTERELHFYNHYQVYYPQFSKEENHLFKDQNINFKQTLQDILDYDFQTFWCVLLFAPDAGAALKEFVTEPVYNFDYDCLDREEMDVYLAVLINAVHVYQRMLRFKESETEYVPEEVGMNFLISRNHLSTPVIMKLTMLYKSIDENFVKKILDLYYSPQRKATYTTELRETLLLIKNLLLAIESVLRESENSSNVEIPNKPSHFDPHWVQEMAAHLVECFYSLSSFLPHLDEAIEIAIELEFPKVIPMVYNNVFDELDSYMADRASVPDQLRYCIHNYFRVARNEAVKSFDAIASYSIRRVVDLANHDKEQEGLVEMYLEWIQEALEYDVFVNDYNCYSNINLQIDQISSFYPNIERLRVKYIKVSIDTIVARLNGPESLREKKEKLKNYKLSDLWNDIWKDTISDPPPLLDFGLLNQKKNGAINGQIPIEASGGKQNEAEIENKIRTIMETLPHLGDGFILQCLEHYNYDVSDTLAAILDENLPPHLAEIPFDSIRIPEETNPESQQPLLAHRGKREDYKDAMQLLNDKTGIKDIKELIIVNSMVKDDPYDDEFDDRTLDDEPTPRDDDDETRVLRHMREGLRNMPVVSDPSDDSTEEEEEDPVKKRDAFCEDPAVIRARREAQRRGNAKGRNFDVVGKPKGQGQEKDVQHNRDKKNVHKANRANHNRKTGAQWKRSRGMMPS